MVFTIWSITKEKLIAIINQMPEEFDLEELIEKLVFIEKVEKGLEQINSDKMLNHEEVKQIIKNW